MIIAATTIALPATLKAADLRLVEYHQRNLAYIIVPRHAQKMQVLVYCHDWHGLTDAAILDAAKIAEEGYLVFLPDMFNGKAPNSEKEAQSLLEELRLPEGRQELLANIKSAHKFIERLEEASAAPVSVHGCGFGAEAAAYIAQSGTIALHS